MSMRILINVNEQVSVTMMARYFEASGLEAEVIVAPTNRMLETLKASKFDLFAFYAEEVDNASLLSFFKSTGELRKILFVKKQNLGLVSEELTDILDECFKIPLDSNDLMIRLRRIYTAAEQKGPQSQPQQTKMAEEVPVFIPQEILEQPQPFLVEPEPEPEPESEPENEPMPVADEDIVPINTAHSYSAESFQPQPAHKVTPVDAPAVEIADPPKEAIKESEAPAINSETDKEPGKKKKSPLRHLNKSDLLEIILEQEKMLAELNGEIAQVKKKLDEREIVLDKAGSIAEAALELNGVFEAAQKSAEQYLESIKSSSILPEENQRENAGESFENH